MNVFFLKPPLYRILSILLKSLVFLLFRIIINKKNKTILHFQLLIFPNFNPSPYKKNRIKEKKQHRKRESFLRTKVKYPGNVSLEIFRQLL